MSEPQGPARPETIDKALLLDLNVRGAYGYVLRVPRPDAEGARAAYDAVMLRLKVQPVEISDNDFDLMGKDMARETTSTQFAVISIRKATFPPEWTDLGTEIGIWVSFIHSAGECGLGFTIYRLDKGEVVGVPIGAPTWEHFLALMQNILDQQRAERLHREFATALQKALDPTGELVRVMTVDDLIAEAPPPPPTFH